MMPFPRMPPRVRWRPEACSAVQALLGGCVTKTKILRSMLALVGAVAVGGCAGGEITPGGDVEPEILSLPHLPSTRVCDEPRAGDDVVCHARVRTDANGIHATANSPSGFGPT